MLPYTGGQNLKTQQPNAQTLGPRGKPDYRTRISDNGTGASSTVHSSWHMGSTCC